MIKSTYMFCCSLCGKDGPWEGRRKLSKYGYIAWACYKCTHRYTTEEMYKILEGQNVLPVKTRADYHADYHINVRPLKRVEGK